MVQIFWNLTGGIFVLRGGFHAPTTAERQEMETDLPETPNGSSARMPIPDGPPRSAPASIRATGAPSSAVD